MLAAVIMAAAAASAQPAADYDDKANWLCRPDRNDACAIELDATEVAEDGTMRIVRQKTAADPRADCFYVYPTLSRDPTPNSDLVPGEEERANIAAQFARFRSVCRTYAPMYRQGTLTALLGSLDGKPSAADPELAYQDVLAAFRHFLAHENKGRPFVLVGHSQGSRLLNRLVKEEIDGKPVARRMLSAMLPGFNTLVPVGKDVGGDFRTIPLCRSDSQINCIIGYVDFRVDAPPPDNSRFGRTPADGMQVACTNPSALAGGTGTPDSYLLNPPGFVWATGRPAVTTLHVKVPGLLSAQCVADAHGSYLAITTHADPSGPRTDRIAGDALDSDGKPRADWGLHGLDMTLMMGDLLRLVDSQTATWVARKPQ